MDTFRKHTKTGFTCEQRLNIAMGYGLRQSEQCIVKMPAGGLPVIRKKMRDMIATERYKKEQICSAGVSSEW